MGDRLRSRLTIASEWHQHEIEEYIRLANSKLSPVYATNKLLINKPWERARYWDENLEIKDNAEIENYTLQLIGINGKPQALCFLEEIAICRYWPKKDS